MTKVKLPYTKVAPLKIEELSENSYHVFVKVKINETNALFIVDTGASGTVIDQQFYLHKLKSRQKTIDQEVRGLNSIQYQVQIGKLKTLTIGKEIIKNAKVSCIDLAHINEAYKSKNIKLKIHGILGSDILKHEEWLIDYKNELIGKWEL
jgi:hypothetical protein